MPTKPEDGRAAWSGGDEPPVRARADEDPTSQNQLMGYRRWATEPLDVRPTISVVVPAYNEEWRIVPTIGAVASHMSTLNEPWELIVADDGSTDRTVALVKDLDLPNLLLLEAEANGGKGSAVRRGVLAASGALILFADADQSTPIEQFSQLRARIEAGADVVVGSRSAVGAEVGNKSMLRSVFSAGLGQLVRGGFGLPVADTQCGFKMFTRAAGRSLFLRQVIDGFSFDLEILVMARRDGLDVEEIPVAWIDAPGSTVDPFRVALDFLVDMARIRWNMARGVYDRINHDPPAVPPRSWQTAPRQPHNSKQRPPVSEVTWMDTLTTRTTPTPTS